MTAPNPFDGLETVPISEATKAAIRQADDVMKAANLPTYTDLVEGLCKFMRRTGPINRDRPITVDWLHEHITPLLPK